MQSKTLSRRELLGILAALGVAGSAVDTFAQVGQVTFFERCKPVADVRITHH